ncbi:hypothetical protein MRB53_036880 [Persea americana]|nr:hypothetical protein MRB53_036880 [Persea americana]
MVCMILSVACAACARGSDVEGVEYGGSHDLLCSRGVEEPSGVGFEAVGASFAEVVVDSSANEGREDALNEVEGSLVGAAPSEDDDVSKPAQARRNWTSRRAAKRSPVPEKK